MVRSVMGLMGLLVVMLAAVAADNIYSQVGIVKGQVFIVNNPELGRTPASGQYFRLSEGGLPPLPHWSEG